MGGTETKPSLKTSEFWIHLALQVFFLLNTAQIWSYMPTKVSGIVQAIMAAGYMLSRGTAKNGSTYVPPAGGTDSEVT